MVKLILMYNNLMYSGSLSVGVDTLCKYLKIDANNYKVGQ